ncbi:MAG: FKBP-type peptidyl-prolyl cis-trans isomerase [Actinomycetaceae bacterium]|nr:FKBP-type peptidyl-prolyl cis-trans isomerase [Actinomycetaceae bacterium]
MRGVPIPEVTGSFGEIPEVIFPETPGPMGLRVHLFEEGTGAVVQAGDEVVVNYHGQIWRGPVFDSSYYREEPARFPIGVGMVIEGWDQALVGQQVGSRVLIAVPPAKGYGAAGNPRAGIKGDDVLLFIVDIVDVKKTAFSAQV